MLAHVAWGRDKRMSTNWVRIGSELKRLQKRWMGGPCTGCEWGTKEITGDGFCASETHGDDGIQV